MKTCVFVGPSAGATVLPEGVHRFGPAVQGSIFLAVKSGYRRIGLADGFFGNVPSVWHKEIIFALACGVQVYGSASMGALRAAELHELGMIGSGKIYRYYRRGLILDDDEVCVIHAVKELHFLPLSLAMVSIRRTLRRMRSTGALSFDEEARIIGMMKSLHFPLRTKSALLECAVDVCGTHRQQTIGYALNRLGSDLKNEDFGEMLRCIATPSRIAPPKLCWGEIETLKWKLQFVESVADLEPLERW